MSFGNSDIYTALNISAITGLLDAYGTGKALFSDSLIPGDFTGHKSINFYINSPFDAATEYNVYTYTANCRASTFGTSQTIAQAIVENVNRTHGSDNYITCSVLQTISPADETDNYNTPVILRLKKR